MALGTLLSLFSQLRNEREDAEGLDLLRDSLSMLFPGEVASLVYRKPASARESAPATDELVCLLAQVRTQFPRRIGLFKWVFGDSRISAQSTYVRLPSLSKRLLATHLAGAARARYPWISSRLLNAWAFRQRYFEEHPSRSWGRLYQVRHIRSGRRKARRIETPFAPLHRIQRLLLKQVLDGPLRTLPPCVFGFRPGAEWTIARLVETHLHQEMVACLDLTDFFPSVRIRHILPALARLRVPMLSYEGTGSRRNSWRPVPRRVDSSNRCPIRESPNRSVQQAPWTWDAALLVSKLVTRNGRLPQGAPTSPAIANIAFASYDLKIQRALGTDLLYTRYADDMVISVSQRTAARLNLRSPSELLSYAAKQITAVLRGSGFKLNSRKSRAGRISEGVEIVGLHLSPGSVTLPRRRRRVIRAMIHALRTNGLVDTAQKNARTEHIHGCRTGAHEGHRSPTRRVSFEQLASQMARITFPDLRVTHFKGDVQENIEDHKRWKYLSNLLYYIWKDVLSAQLHDDYVLFRRTSNNTAVCRISGAQRFDFFRLPFQDAARCVEYWHHVRGVAAFLQGIGRSRYAPDAKRTAEALYQLVSNPRIECAARQVPRRSRPARGTVPIALTAEETDVEEFRKQVSRLFLLVEDFRQFSDCIANPSLKAKDTLSLRAESGDTLREWLAAWRDIFIDGLTTVPPSATKTLDASRICSDQLHRARNRDYISESVVAPPHEPTPSEKQTQTRLVQLLYQCFHDSKNRRLDVGPERWRSELEPYEWRGDPHCSRRTKSVVDQLRSVLHKAITPDGGNAILDRAAHAEFSKVEERATTAVSGDTAFEHWTTLFSLALQVWKSFFETLARHEWQDVKRWCGDDEVSKAIRPLYWMRNFAAHVVDWSDPERKREWREITRYVARRIGRRQPARKDTAAGRSIDFDLTPLETAEARLRILEDVLRVWQIAVSASR